MNNLFCSNHKHQSKHHGLSFWLLLHPISPHAAAYTHPNMCIVYSVPVISLLPGGWGSWEALQQDLMTMKSGLIGSKIK